MTTADVISDVLYVDIVLVYFKPVFVANTADIKLLS